MIRFNKILLVGFFIFNLNLYGNSDKLKLNNSLVIKNYQPYKVDLNLTNNKRFKSGELHPGIVLMVGGISFFTAGILTSRVQNGSNSGYWPWYKQFERTAAITTGITLFASGIIYTINF